jgi:1-acyl-sn-glycerol-3-phosphate acyltransferase
LDETRLERWSRRGITIPGYVGLSLLLGVTYPVLAVGALGVDLVRRSPGVLLRCVTFLLVYGLCETAGLLASFGVWLAGGARRRSRAFLDRNFRLQCWWADSLFRSARALFGMRLVVEGEDALPAHRFLLMPRHASIADTVLPAVLLSKRRGIRLRYVMKRELLWDPCLDVVGQRLPNAFVRRGSVDGAREIGAVARLAADLGPEEGILIYPEGTRFTPAKRERVLARLRGASDPLLAERASSLRHVLPPRLGGPLALLDARPDADVVFCAHVGLEGARTFRELFRGNLVGRTIRVAFWRVPAADVPAGREGRVAWLYANWARLDAWVGAAGAG